MGYLKKILDAPTPQTEQGNPKQVANSAGGFSFKVDEWARLERFLILGSEGGSYYASERALTVENAKQIKTLIEKDGVGVVATTVRISQEGRAPKNGPALFVIAMCLSYGNDVTKQLAKNALPSVARTGSHLMEFVSYVDSMRGWGRGLRKTVANWYLSLKNDNLAYQGIKYRNRNGWTHADLLRQSHPKTNNETRNAIFKWMVDGWENVGEEPHPDKTLRTIWAYERAQQAITVAELAQLITDYNLPREAIPNNQLGSQSVWEALLQKMPLTALIRNLGKMTNVGLLTPNSDAAKLVMDKLNNPEHLARSRIHPLAVLIAQKVYASGAGMKGGLTWKPVAPIVDALETAFYSTFGYVPSTAKRWVMGLDVSGSMTYGNIAGLPITPREASAVLAMVTVRREPQYFIAGFTNTFVDLKIQATDNLASVSRKVQRANFGTTDCSLPMQYALKNKIPADVFAVYTDNETYAGSVHPHKALEQYRQKMGIDAKLIVVGMVANNFTIANPDDAGMLDVVGFDTATPAVMSQFVGGGAVGTDTDED